MISQALARQLHGGGRPGPPRAGARSAARSPELDGEVSTAADMVDEAREYPSGTLLAFNGTTEWALDSVQLDQTLWLPLEHQLRELLGAAFRGLAPGPAGYEVRVQIPGRTAGSTFTATDPADAYAQALLALAGASAAEG